MIDRRSKKDQVVVEVVDLVVFIHKRDGRVHPGLLQRIVNPPRHFFRIAILRPIQDDGFSLRHRSFRSLTKIHVGDINGLSFLGASVSLLFSREGCNVAAIQGAS
jgi:hypothetical protein